MNACKVFKILVKSVLYAGINLEMKYNCKTTLRLHSLLIKTYENVFKTLFSIIPEFKLIHYRMLQKIKVYNIKAIKYLNITSF